MSVAFARFLKRLSAYVPTPDHTPIVDEEAHGLLRQAPLHLWTNDDVLVAAEYVLDIGDVALTTTALEVWKAHRPALLARSGCLSDYTEYAPCPVWRSAPHPIAGAFWMEASLVDPTHGFEAMVFAWRDHLQTPASQRDQFVPSLLLLDGVWDDRPDRQSTIHLCCAILLSTPTPYTDALYARLSGVANLNDHLDHVFAQAQNATPLVHLARWRTRVELITLLHRHGLAGQPVSAHRALAIADRLPSKADLDRWLGEPNGIALAYPAVVKALAAR